MCGYVPLTATWPKTQACALTGNQTGNPLAHRPELNPLSHNSQGYYLLVLYTTPNASLQSECPFLTLEKSSIPFRMLLILVLNILLPA